MAAKSILMETQTQKPSNLSCSSSLSSYLGVSFALFLGHLPKSSLSYISSLQSRNRILSLKLFHAEDQIKSLRSRRKEDSKANARVVEIFASHRHAWQQEERRLIQRIEAASEEMARLRDRIGELEMTMEKLETEREEMMEFVARKEEEVVGFGDFEGIRVSSEEMDEIAAAAAYYEEKVRSGRELLDSVGDSRRWQQV